MIPISRPSITDKEISYVTEAVNSGWVSSMGKYIERFESEFATYCGVKFAVSTSNGTVALHLAIYALGIGEGDEVIIPDLTFVATGNAVKYVGAKVVTVDIDLDTLCICPDSLERAITSKTKAIIPVHLYGQPANMERVMAIAKKYNLIVIEDAAEAHGAELDGVKVGSIGDAGVFSFYGNKIITCGEGGMVTTNDEKLFHRLRYLRDHAMSQTKKYWHEEMGFNYRMTNLQAALGVAQLERIDEIIKKKITIHNWYVRELSSIKNLKLMRSSFNTRAVYWMVCITIPGYSEKQRNYLMNHLKNNGIDSRPYFYPLSDMPGFDKSETPVAHSVFKEGLNLPSYYDILEEEVIEVSRKIKEFMLIKH